MLVLTRRVEQTITIGNPHTAEDAIEITVTEIRGDQVRLGIKAPPEIPVHRKEIWLLRQDHKAAEMPDRT